MCSPAVWTNRSETGTSGGALVATKKHLAVTPLKTRKEDSEEASGGRDWAMVGIKAKGATILVASIYLTAGLGYAGEISRS